LENDVYMSVGFASSMATVRHEHVMGTKQLYLIQISCYWSLHCKCFLFRGW